MNDQPTECPFCGEPADPSDIARNDRCEECHEESLENQRELDRLRDLGRMDDSDPRKPMYAYSDVL